MTCSKFKILAVSLLVGSMGQAALSFPAYAGGQISLNLAPQNSGDADLFSTGMRVYSLYRNLKSADIRQFGNGNAAGIAQAGSDNIGFIQQRGNGHSASLRQTGNRNAYGIFQFGRNTRSDVIQDGDGGSGATVSYGW